MNDLISLGVAGFRIDAAKHMWPADLSIILASVNDLSTEFFPSGSRALIYQEVVDTGRSSSLFDFAVLTMSLLGSDPVYNTDYTSFGRVCEFKYGAELAPCFKGNNPLKYLSNWGTGWGLLDGQNTLVFIENHDTERDSTYLTYKQDKPYKAAIAFMLAHSYDGLIKIMSSYDFSYSDQGD